MTGFQRSYPTEQVAYAAASYALAKGITANEDLFAYLSDSQVLIAAAVYDSHPPFSWRKVALCCGCPTDRIASLDTTIRNRRTKGQIDAELLRVCTEAATHLRVFRTLGAQPLQEAEPAAEPAPAPDHSQAAEPATVKAPRPPRPPSRAIPVVRKSAPPPEPRITPPTQFKKPQTDLDREIYGTSLTTRPKIDPKRSVTIPMPGDKPEDWKPPAPPVEADPDEDSDIVEVESRDLTRLGSIRIAPSKKISLPKVSILDRKDLDNV